MTDENIKKLKDEIERLEKTYAEELKRKDKIIDELQSQNEVMFKAALKSSTKIDDLLGKLEKAMKKK